MSQPNLKRIMGIACGIILGMLVMAVDSHAVTGTIKVNYGLTTTYSATVPGNSCPPVQTTASATGTGDGGTVSVGGSGISNNNTYTGTNNKSSNNQTVTVTPTGTNKIASIKLVRYYTDCSTDTVTDITISGNGTGTTSFTVNVNRNRFYLLIVDFDSNVQYTLSYSVVADVAATPATTCNSSATVTYGGSPLASGANINIPISNTGVQFTIDNSSSSCEVEAIQFNNGSWDTTVWNSGTKLYNTPVLTANSTFKIRYRGASYTVTTITDPTGDTTCGSIAPATQVYGAGSTIISTVTVNPGCAVASFTDSANGGAALSASKTYTIASIAADHTLTVKFARVTASTGSGYCQVPPFMDGQNVLKPNVLIIFDTSGSMGQNPYSGKTYTCVAASTLSSCSNFDGYFAKDKMYKIVSGKYYIDTSVSLNLASSTGTGTGRGMSGNYLNYRNMHKIDILRYILVGGQVDPVNGSPRTAATGGSNTRFLSTDSNLLIEYGTTNPTGLIHTIADKVNMGMMVFNDNDSGGLDNDGASLSAEIGSSRDTLIAQIESSDTDPNGFTPLAESLYEAFRYLQGGTSAYNTYDGTNLVSYAGTATDALTPHRVFKKPVQGSCQSNFILLITDGAPTNDTVAAMTSSTIDTNLKNWQTTHTATAGANVPTTQLGKLAYYMHNYDLTNATPTWGKPADPSKLQSITVSTVFSFGDTTGAATLEDASRFGSYLEDKSITDGTSAATAYGKTNTNGIPDRYAEWLTVQPVSPATPVLTNTRGYYEADDAPLLASQLQSYFLGIINNTASGTAAAVANNKSGQRGANMIQALFYPQFPTNPEIKWLGEVQSIWYYLDPVINYSNIYEDTNNDGMLDIASDSTLPSDPFDTNAIWRAGAMLHKTAASSRNIYAHLDATQSTPGSPVDITVGSANLFTTTNRSTLKPLINASALTDTQAETLIDYLRGVDSLVYRSRAVDYTYTRPENGSKLITTTSGKTDAATSRSTGVGVWKLGDIINSTPIVQSSVPLNAYNNAYADSSYGKFISTSDYKARNTVYTGANDGMLHAFKLGNTTTLTDSTHPFQIARVSGTDLGAEQWAFIPHNALPYLQNQCAGDYCHQYLVDGAPTVVDAAINMPTGCTASNYWDCDRTTATTTSGSTTSLNASGTSWRTVLISSMGLGGASRDSASTCKETTAPDTDANNNTDCVKTPVAGNGLSSYFAFDVTDPLTPKFMWEFSDYSISAAADKGIGFTTPGASVIHVNSTPQAKSKNGRWFAVMASGPTGSIDSTQRFFSGRSDQNLKLYIVDLNAGSTFIKCTSAGQTGCNYWVKDTGIPFAFANSLSGSAIDLDRWNSTKDGNFSDSVVYVTYTKAALTNHAANPSGDFPSSATAWNRGGVLRLVTNHDSDPYYWFTSPLIGETDCTTSVSTGCVGPITTSVARIQDRNANSGAGRLWLFFGEGRYFFPGDERTVSRKIFGVQDPCYNQYSNSSNTPSHTLYAGDDFGNYAMGTSTSTCPAVDMSTILDQSYSSVSHLVSGRLPSDKKGWVVSLDVAGGSAGAERNVSDVSATFNGVVFYTTYTPNTDVCTPGGVSSLWAIQYNTGVAPPPASMKGKAPIQTSSGGIKLVDLETSFTQREGRKLGAQFQPSGMAPKGRFPPLLSPKPSKQILQIQEK